MMGQEFCITNSLISWCNHVNNECGQALPLAHAYIRLAQAPPFIKKTTSHPARSRRVAGKFKSKQKMNHSHTMEMDHTSMDMGHDSHTMDMNNTAMHHNIGMGMHMVS